MSKVAEPTAAQPPPARRRVAHWWATAESLLEQAGERLNPILVKEARQALKSRLFVMTFGLLLICAWGGTIVGLAIIGPEAAFGFHGSTMFAVYFVILAFALLVIVPFGAFRSLAVEQEDRTYELLSITALGPAQIVRGKLTIALLQMLIYLSAISPCLGFTYLLRGIDFLTILYVLGWLVLASLGLSAIGLLLGTLTEQRQLQVILSVLTIVGLLFAFGFAIGLAMVVLFELPLPFSEPYFWTSSGALVSVYLSYMVLVYLAAVSRITFASQNRSTPLRVVMVVQHMLLTGWLAVLAIVEQIGAPRFYATCMILLVLHWYAMGSVMLGESPELSLRARRRLPQSFLGRVFLTWFNPGPATGYVFALCGALGGVAMTGIAAAAASSLGIGARRGPGPMPADRALGVLVLGVLFLCYAAFYLGVGLLLIRLLRRWARIDVLGAALIQVVLVLLGCGLPPVIQAMSLPWRSQGWTVLQVTNFFWTLSDFLDVGGFPPRTGELLVLLPSMALVVFALNLRAIRREIEYVRVAKPARVADEDAALAPPPPPPPRPSPWD